MAHPHVVRVPPDFSASDVEILQLVSSYTLTSMERIYALCRAVEYVIEHDVPGDIVECGVWRGGSMMAVARTLIRLGAAPRRLHLFDTFDGMSAPTDMDTSFTGESAQSLLAAEDRSSSDIWACCPLDAVKQAMGSVGYDERHIVYVQGKVEDTLPMNAPEQISLLRLDTDWYESTRHELECLFPRLAVGGVLIIDDYGHWKGARRAVDEYFERHHTRILLNRIDYTGRIAVKLE